MIVYVRLAYESGHTKIYLSNAHDRIYNGPAAEK